MNLGGHNSTAGNILHDQGSKQSSEKTLCSKYASTDKFLVFPNRSASGSILTASRTGETLNKERSANLLAQILRYCSPLACLEAGAWTTMASWESARSGTRASVLKASH